MTKKRFTAIPETVSYKDNLTGERLCPKHEKDYYAVLNKMNKLSEENKQLKQQIEELEFKLRTIEAYDRTAKEEHSDTIYDFKKKLETW